MWALMDHNPQLMEDFAHANLEAPEASGAARHAGPSSQPAIMVRPPSDPPILIQAAQPGRAGCPAPFADMWACAPSWLCAASGLPHLGPAPMQACPPCASTKDMTLPPCHRLYRSLSTAMDALLGVYDPVALEPWGWVCTSHDIM